MKIILVMGLPGAGKTTLADELAPMLDAKRLNADEIRKVTSVATNIMKNSNFILLVSQDHYWNTQ